jgi:hypothetical protein
LLEQILSALFEDGDLLINGGVDNSLGFLKLGVLGDVPEILRVEQTHGLGFLPHLEAGAPEGARDDDGGEETCYGISFPFGPCRND